MDIPCLHQWFEIQAGKTPDAIAVVFENQKLSYGELNQRANQLAQRLIGFGIGSDVLVALCLERSLEMIIAILGVLKAGGAYLPLDLAYPEERLAFMLRDAKPPVFITQRSLLSRVTSGDATVVCVDDDFDGEPNTSPGVKTLPEHLAYSIYTSGSTGKPKGVMITHRNAVRLFTATEHWYRFSPVDVWTMFVQFFCFQLSCMCLIHLPLAN